MAKGRKGRQKNYKLRRQLRRTFGCLFMITAIIVAAVPVQPTEAKIEDAATKVVVLNQTNELGKWEDLPTGSTVQKAYNSEVPYVDQNATIYTTGDGRFHFAYMEPKTTTANKVAVILGYSNIGSLENNALTIPDTVDAYRKYSTNTTQGEACAVSRNNEFLFYKVTEQVQKKDPITGEPLYKQTAPALMRSDTYKAMPTEEQKKYKITQGDPDNDDNIWVTTIDYDSPIMEDKISYRPCYYSTRESWDKNAAGDKVFGEDELYYRETDTNGNLVTDPSTGEYNYLVTDQQEHQRIHDALVGYIGNQQVVAGSSPGVEWEVGPYITSQTPEKGIFAGNSNIVALTIGKNLMGIGDYAFYNCRGLGQVNLGNGLEIIGNGAFAGCINLTTCNIDSTANIEAIGKDAFSGCVALTKFAVPTALEGIGDSCFEDCRSLSEIDLGSGSRNVSLKILGDNVFKGCESLKGIAFPQDYKETLGIGSIFSGCSGLKYIKAPNNVISFTDEKTAVEAFKGMVGNDFYFEAPDSSPLHDLAIKYGFAFKYLDQDIYEKVIIAYDTHGMETGRTTWKVNSNNELIDFSQSGVVENLEVPDQIGPYHITKISARGFSGNCALKKIIIPSSVTDIGPDAFLGCHNLKDVIFEEPINLSSIGTDAFATQKSVGVHVDCPTGGTIAPVPELTFTGTVDPSSLPFKYAMMPTSLINYGQQPKTWIKFYSGWPSNLTIQYNPDTGKNELLDYPLYRELKNYNLDSYPYMTQEYVDAASNAVTVYEDYYLSNGSTKPTQYQEEIVNSALNLVLPAGITGIKSGIFSGKDSDGAAISGLSANVNVQSVTTSTIDEIPAYGFAGCGSLKSFYMGGGTKIGNYAFDGDTGLTYVEIPASVTEMGLRPFRGCINTSSTVATGLTHVTFKEGGNFTCNNGIIYGVNGGKNTRIIECLETRGRVADVISGMVGPEELADVTEIADEAFRGCNGVGEVNLSSSSVKGIPEKCFANTDSLYKVTLPDTCMEIEKGAFWNSFLGNIVIPNSVKRIAPEAFSNTADEGATFEDHSQHKTIDVICLNDSDAAFYAKDYSYMKARESDDLKARFTVTFYTIAGDATTPLGEPVKVISGEDAELPVLPEIDGYEFEKWLPSVDAAKNIVKDTEMWAVYKVKGEETFTVEFINWDDKVIDVQTVVRGKDALTPSKTPERDGYLFTGWRGNYSNVQENLKIYAMFQKEDSDASKFTVTFYNGDTVISTQRVAPGESAIEPVKPTLSGYTFTGWLPPTAWQNVTEDMKVYAQFQKDDGTGGGGDSSVSDNNSGNNNGGDDNNGNNNNGNNGNNNNGNNNNGNSNNNNGSNNNGSSSSGNSVSGNSTKYKVVVNGGSGTGEYTAGTIITINAYFTNDGKVFDKWTSSSSGVGFVNAEAASTNFTMPANNVEITATFKNPDSSSVSGNSRNTLRNATNNVELTKSGISNKDLASANVNGASNAGDYSVRISEDASATAAVIAALEAKYGDLSNIAYLPMDISLYNSNGEKVTTAGGVTVDITLPLPDELAQYQGNNRAASVSNGVLEELNATFTTIDGVPCIRFTATHFSPYTIYVDKANLTAGTIDATPKTGDPIHPKWFLAIALACISVILFCKKDKAPKKVKAA